jgi:pyruvate kinase
MLASQGRPLLDANTQRLLGDAPRGRDVRIMVTLPSEAADNYSLVKALLASGTDSVRINTAHDDREAWDRMVAHVTRAREELGRPCRILIDLAGPKLRTGPIRLGPSVLSWRPQRDVYGRVKRPARIWLTASDSPSVAPERADAVLHMDGRWLGGLITGDVIKFFDARDSKRALDVVATSDTGIWAESAQTAFVVPGLALHVTRGIASGSAGAPIQSAATIGPVPAVTQSIRLSRGDTLILTRSLEPGAPAVLGADAGVLEPATIGVTLPEIFDDVQPGEHIWLDDGSIGGVIRTVDRDRLEIEITHAKPGGSKLAADKGINLPDSHLRLPALTAKDIEDLPFIAERADLVGYSFVHSADDVEALQARLKSLGKDLGIILKIETKRAFEQLPALLLAAMRSPSSGVMIARGDLAVECGYERLAEVQEEILWLAEASHTPVIWATQVLETLVKDGMPSRAEITDAAMGERAECVMLNKGPHVVAAVRVLDDILTRMQAHQQKKSAMLRHLALADRFLGR